MQETERRVIVALEERYRAKYCVLVRGDIPDERIIELLNEDYVNGIWDTDVIGNCEGGACSYRIEIENKAPDATSKPDYTLGPDPETIVHKVTLTEDGITTVIFEGKGEGAYDKCTCLMDLLKKDDRIVYSSSLDDPAIKGFSANDSISMTPAIWDMTEENYEFLRDNWFEKHTEEHSYLGSVSIGSMNMEFATRTDGGDTFLHTTDKEWKGSGAVDEHPMAYLEDGTPFYEVCGGTQNDAPERAIIYNCTLDEFKRTVEAWLRQEFPKETSMPNTKWYT